MLLYALTLSYLACMILRPLHTFPQRYYPGVKWIDKLAKITRLTLVMCIAW